MNGETGPARAAAPFTEAGSSPAEKLPGVL